MKGRRWLMVKPIYHCGANKKAFLHRVPHSVRSRAVQRVCCVCKEATLFMRDSLAAVTAATAKEGAELRLVCNRCEGTIKRDFTVDLHDPQLETESRAYQAEQN